MEGLKEFLAVHSGYGYGSGYGSGDGDGYGYGSGDGCGYGSGDGSGYGSGDGSGYGSGYGYGDGDGSGYGDGDGDGLISYNGQEIHYIDEIPTVITQLKGSVAKGFIVGNDLSQKPVFVVKVGNSFAHGKTMKDAVRDAQKKHLQNLPIGEKIENFLNEFKGVDMIPAKDLFEWHFNLTGSCEFGRKNFIEQKGINLDKDSFTIKEFVDLTKNEYGGDIVKQLLD